MVYAIKAYAYHVAAQHGRFSAHCMSPQPVATVASVMYARAAGASVSRKAGLFLSGRRLGQATLLFFFFFEPQWRCR